MHGHFYQRNDRWYWKIKFPGDEKISQIPLKPAGSKFATKDLKTAEIVADDIWQKKLRESSPQKWDGKLATLVKKYHARNLEYYLPPSREAYRISHAIFLLAELYSDIPADDFSSLKLKEFQQYLVDAGKLCRKLINERVKMIKRMFKWAASETLISVHTYTALTTVEGLRKGRTKARESKRVLPANLDMVNAVINVVTPVIADMIRVQLFTGMRSGELCQMQPCNIDNRAEIWVYTPESHKGSYLEHDKFIPIGPRAQAVLEKYMFRKPIEYIFKPEESYKAYLKRKSENRKTPISCGNKPGSNRKGTFEFKPRYSADTYQKAVKRACKILWPAPSGLSKEEKKKWQTDHSWHPHQLRHNAATEIRKTFGIDAARAVLGHKNLTITEVYAEMDIEKALAVAKKIG